MITPNLEIETIISKEKFNELFNSKSLLKKNKKELEKIKKQKYLN